MAARTSDRDPASSTWPIHPNASQPGHQHRMRPPATQLPPISTAPAQPPWPLADRSAAASAPAPVEAASVHHPPCAAPAADRADQTSGSPLTKIPAPVVRPRAFDPARDLNPANPVEPVTSPSSSWLSSPSTENNRQTLDSLQRQGDYFPMGQALSSRPRGSSVASPGPARQDLSEIQSRYQLEVVEHPGSARASTFGDRDRRVINPPPVLRLSLRDFNPTEPYDLKCLTWAYNIVTCTLWRLPNLDSPESEWVEVTQATGRKDGGLMGSLVASPLVTETPDAGFSDDPSEPPSCYYVFSDLSCRHVGLYRLKFGLTTIRDDFFGVGGYSPTVAYAWTKPFEVHSAKDFPGVGSSSRLLRYLKSKGANVTLKKEKEPAAADAAARKRARAITTSDASTAPSAIVDVKRPRAVFDSLDGGSKHAASKGTGHPDQSGPDD